MEILFIMSHFVEYESQITKKEFIKIALKEMGLVGVENQEIVDYYKQRQVVDIAVQREGQILPIGFVKKQLGKDKTYSVVADWFRTSYNEKTFMEQINMNHALANVKETLSSLGWEINEQTINDNGEIVVEALNYEYV